MKVRWITEKFSLMFLKRVCLENQGVSEQSRSSITAFLKNPGACSSSAFYRIAWGGEIAAPGRSLRHVLCQQDFVHIIKMVFDQRFKVGLSYGKLFSVHFFLSPGMQGHLAKLF